MQKNNKYVWLKQLHALERYCNEKGYRVVCKAVDVESMYYTQKLITLSSKWNDETAFYLLLHEMGHARLIDNSEKYDKTWGHVFDNFSHSSLTYGIAILSEELDAWKEGLILADNLNFYVNRRKWEMIKTRCISSYVSWVENKKQKPKPKPKPKQNKEEN